MSIPPEKECVTMKYPYPTVTCKLWDSFNGYENMKYLVINSTVKFYEQNREAILNS